MQGPGHREDVQGLRGLAVALVALHHAGWTALPGGYVGVDVFFVLSGFLITGLLLEEGRRTGRVSLSGFYARRARRLLPAAVLVLLATVAGARLLLDPVTARAVQVDAVWAGLFAANVRFGRSGTDYFARDLPPSPLQHYWSLAVEEQYYLAVPLLVLLVLLTGRRLRARLATALLLLGTASLAWCLVRTGQDPTGAYFSSPARAWELAAGGLVAVAARRVPGAAPLSWLALGGVVAAAVLYDDRTAFPGAAALLPVGATALLLATSGGPASAARLLAVRPLAALGDVSYAFYLWHWPLLVLAAARLQRDLTPAEALAVLGVALAAAALSTRLLEDPVRRSPLLRARPRLALALWPASAATAGALAAVLVVTAPPPAAPPPAPLAAPAPAPPAPAATPEPPALPAVRASVERAAEPLPDDLVPDPARLRSDTSSLAYDCLAHEEDVRSRLCVTGHRRASRTVVLLGDSHAFMWLPALQRMGREDGWRVVVVMKFACTAADVTIRNGTPSDATCDTWRRWALPQVEALRPDLVVAAGQVPTTVLVDGQPVTELARVARLWGAGWQRTLARLRPHAGRVVLLQDGPGLPRDPLACVARPGARRGDCTYPPVPRTARLDEAARQGARAAGVAWLPVQGWFCWQRRCPVVVGRTVTYRDPGHITATYAGQLWQVLRDALAEVPETAAPRPATAGRGAVGR